MNKAKILADVINEMKMSDLMKLLEKTPYGYQEVLDIVHGLTTEKE